MQGWQKIWQCKYPVGFPVKVWAWNLLFVNIFHNVVFRIESRSRCVIKEKHALLLCLCVRFCAAKPALALKHNFSCAKSNELTEQQYMVYYHAFGLHDKFVSTEVTDYLRNIWYTRITNTVVIYIIFSFHFVSSWSALHWIFSNYIMILLVSITCYINKSYSRLWPILSVVKGSWHKVYQTLSHLTVSYAISSDLNPLRPRYSCMRH